MKILKNRTEQAGLLLLLIILFSGKSILAQWGQVYTQSISTSNSHIQFTNDTTGYVQFASNLYKTTNSGITWNLIDSIPLSPYSITTVMFFLNSSEGFIIYNDLAGNSSYLKKTLDGGVSWSAPQFVCNNLEVKDMQFTSALVGWAITPLYLYQTTNGGATWVTSIGGSGNAVTFVSPTIGFTAGGQIKKTIDGGVTWTTSLPGPVSIQSLTFISASVGFASDGYGILKTADGGLTWVRKFYDVHGAGDVAFVTSLIGYATTGVQPLGTYGNSIYATSDGGETWELSSITHYAIDMDFTTNGTGYYVGYQEINKNVTTTCPTVSSLDSIYYKNTSDSIQLYAIPSFPGTYTYAWSPASYFVDASVQNPMFIGPSIADSTIISVVLNSTIPSCSPDTLSMLVYTLGVSAGNDTSVCGALYNSIQLHASAFLMGPSSTTVAYSWSPVIGLSDPFSAQPYVNNVTNQTYVVRADFYPLYISAYDTVTVNVHNSSVDTGYYCTGGATLAIGAINWGAGSFLWNTGDSTSVIHVDSAGIYTCIANYLSPSCSVTSQFTIIDSCAAASNVWPGDTDDDLISNNYDVLNIGLGYGDMGAMRPGASYSWVAQPMTDWLQYFSTGVNYKHADCNGNGIINISDDTIISYNYNYTHPPLLMAHNSPERSTADLYLVAQYDTVGLMATVNFAIMLGNTGIPIDSIYGIAYSLSYDADLTYQPMTVNYFNSWFGDPASTIFSFEKSFHSDGYIDLAVSRNDHTNVTGNGQIGNAIIVTTDNVSGINSVLNVDIYDVKAVTISGTIINLTVAGDSVVIDSSFTSGIHNIIDLQQTISVYPNPSNGMVHIVSASENIHEVKIHNAIGKEIYTVGELGTNAVLDLNALDNGIYFVSVKTDAGIINKRLTINR